MKLERPVLKWWERLYIPTILKGLLATLRHLPRKKFTRFYPEEKPKLLGAYRGVPTLVTNPEGRVKCVACQMCEFVCPPKAIRIVPGNRSAAPGEAKVEKEPAVFEIDMLRCIYCGLCEEACPEEAIFLQKDFAVAGFTREEMVFDKKRLLEMGGVRKDTIRKWENK